MSATEFTPDRSAALRELLLNTVRDEPKRQRRLQILLTSVLAAIAIVLAGGTAALALTGVIHFGGDSPAPAPAPTSTVTPTPTPTATPSPSPTKPLVQTTPIAPHDVDSLPASTRWAIDLPGANSDCTYMKAYSLSDGRALYLTGLRPKEYEGSSCSSETTENIGLALVDTSMGSVLWARDWTFPVSQHLRMTDFLVLGNSGRAVISYEDTSIGPQEVIDLSTGATVSPYVPVSTGQPLMDAVVTPGDSGDLVAVTAMDYNANTMTVARFDPRDAAHPRWTTPLDHTGSITAAAIGADTVGVTFVESGDLVHASSGVLSLATGELVRRSDGGGSLYGFSRITLRQFQIDDTTNTIVAQDGHGNELWRKNVNIATTITEVATADQQPGAPGLQAVSGMLAMTDQSTITIVDEVTGVVSWTSPLESCGPLEQRGYPVTTMDGPRNAYVTVFPGAGACTMAQDTGAILAPVGIPLDGWRVQGATSTYGYDPGADSVGTAYDRGTGAALWTRPRHQYESWSFDGGFLVSHDGTHIESIG